MTKVIAVAEHPNRAKPESIRTRAIVVLLLLVSTAVLTTITVAGWPVLEGGQTIQIAYIALYLAFALMVGRWNRGTLALASALALILIIFAGVAGPGWFNREKSGFESPLLPETLIGLLTLMVIPLQMLLIVFAMRGFRQNWNVEG